MMDNNGDNLKEKLSFGGIQLRDRLMKERAQALELLGRNSQKVSSSTSDSKNPNYKESVGCEKSKTDVEGGWNWKASLSPKNSAASKVSPTKTIESEKSQISRQQQYGVSLRALQNISPASSGSQSKLYAGDYIPLRKAESNELSTLILGESISLECSALPQQKDTDVSFHPAEMGGRSTLHIRHSKPKLSNTATLNISVDEIVEKSFANSTASSCISGFSAMQRNPRPTTLYEEMNANFSTLSCFVKNSNNISNFNDDDFVPAENMQSKLLQDEIAWANEHAVVPTAVLSNEARKKLCCNGNDHHKDNNKNCSFNDTNFSVGQFFAGRSNNISDIIQGNLPNNAREPVALISCSTITSTSSPSPEHTYEVMAPLVIDKKRHRTKGEDDTSATVTITKLAANDRGSHDSKDSGNASEKGDVLSLSTIDRILACSDNNTGSKAIMDMLKKSSQNESKKKTKSIESISISAPDLVKRAEQLNEISNKILENKENIETHGRFSESMAETLSFTDSLLNTSIQNYRKSSAGQARLPLSPIPIIISDADNVENDADVDEFHDSPVISPGRRKQLKKSPSKSSGSSGFHIDDLTNNEKPDVCNEAVTPVAAKCQKTLSSTRTEGGDHFSPVASSGTLTPTHPYANSVFELSPLSSCQSEAGIVMHKQSKSINSWQCGGGAPMRTYSSNSIKSSDGTSTRSTSRCSSNSEFSHGNGGDKIPIKATELELSWPSVKLRKDSQKSTQVKNTSGKRLTVRIEIFGPGFKLISPENNTLTLLPEECRKIIVNFSPTVIGPAIGGLVFRPPRKFVSNNKNTQTHKNNTNTNPNNEVIIPLYAYGGHACIIIQNLLRGPIGEPFVPIGELCAFVRPLERSIEIHNKGTLMGFAAVFIEPGGRNIPEMTNSIGIHPECALIEPNNSVIFRLVIQPNNNDLKNIRKIIDKVLTLAKLRIIYGDEAIRQRLRQIQRLMDADVRKNIFRRSLDKLCTRFPGEQAMFSHGTFKDSPNVVQELWSSIFEQDVALTINNNNMLDETVAEVSTIFNECDNSVLFRSLRTTSLSPTLAPSNNLETVDERFETNSKLK